MSSSGDPRTSGTEEGRCGHHPQADTVTDSEAHFPGLACCNRHVPSAATTAEEHAALGSGPRVRASLGG